MDSVFVNDILGVNSPDSPDYFGAAEAMYGSGINAAIINAIMNRPNEVTPFGSRTWEQTGSTSVGGYSIPNYTSNISLDPALQGLFDKQFAFLNESLGNPLDMSKLTPLYSEKDLIANRDAVTDAMYRRSTAMLDPQYAKAEDKATSGLVNKGFSIGDKGYDDAMSDFSRMKDAAYGDARDRALLAGSQEQSRLFDLNLKDRQQDISELLLDRTQPANELKILMGFIPGFQNYWAGSNVNPAQYLPAANSQGNFDLGLFGAQSKFATDLLNWGSSLFKPV